MLLARHAAKIEAIRKRAGFNTTAMGRCVREALNEGRAYSMVMFMAGDTYRLTPRGGWATNAQMVARAAAEAPPKSCGESYFDNADFTPQLF